MVDVNKLHIMPAVIGAYTTNPSGWGAGQGAWGCARTHSRILEDVMHVRDDRGEMALRNVLILEDDVYFVDNALHMLNEFMPKVPRDWGQIYLGGQHQRPTDLIPEIGVLIGNSVNRTHAYAVSRTHIQAVYRHINNAQDYIGTSKHIDHQLEVAHYRKDWPVYCPVKWIAGQEAGKSDISGLTNRRMLWNP